MTICGMSCTKHISVEITQEVQHQILLEQTNKPTIEVSLRTLVYRIRAFVYGPECA